MEYTGKIVKYWEEMLKNIFDYEGDVETFKKIFKDNQVKSVLDVGCGTGKHLRLLAKLGYECTGIDDSKEMLEVAREKAEEEELKIEFIECDMRDIKIKKSHDAVTCMYTITFPDIEDTKRIFNSIYNVLKDDGILVFDIISAEGIPGMLPRAKMSLEEERSLEAKMSPKTPVPPTFFNMEVLVGDREDLKIIRLNNFCLKGMIQEWDPVYLIEEDGKLTMEIYQSEVRMFYLDEIKKVLQESGFEIESVIHRRIQILKNELICARKKR